MLETLVSSRIRRALFEHILAHPDERFYLRGLAKELGLSISPLRRELKRLEHAGVLRSLQEANLVFYTVNTSAPLFLQLSRPALQPTEAPSPAMAPSPQRMGPVGFSAPVGPAVSVGIISAAPSRAPVWRKALSGPALVGVAGAGLALVLLFTGIAYMSLVNHRLLAKASRALQVHKTKMEVVTLPPTPESSSGVMHGARWQLIPGSFGGFSAHESVESY